MTVDPGNIAPAVQGVTPDNVSLLDQLRTIVGRRHVLTGEAGTRRYRTGFHFGSGPALAVVRPGTLVEQWKVLKACAAAGKIIIIKAANTGLTGGSTPDGSDYDREIVIISTLRMARIRLINDGRQVICLPGATLYQLENALTPLGRDPHSVIGSSCIGASVLGGICNNSGGALIHRGPAYTQMALFARIDEAGEVHLANHLASILVTRRKPYSTGSIALPSPKPTSNIRRIAPPRTTTTPPMSVILTPPRRDVSTSTRSGSLKRPAAPAR
jgi:D-lactate dehydrogenase